MMDNKDRLGNDHTVYKKLKRLIELGEAKREHMECILDITCKQAEVLSAEQVDKLLVYIDNKQEHIDVIKALDEEFVSVYDEIKRILFSPGFKEQSPEGWGLYVNLRSIINDIYSKVESVYELETQNQSRLNEVIQDIKARISSINRGKKGYKAYKQQALQSDGIFVDQKK